MVDYDRGLAKRGGDFYLLSSCISILAMIMTSRSANSRSSGVDSKEYKELKKKLSQLAQVTQCSLTLLVNELLSKNLLSETEHSDALNTNQPALDRATAVIKSVLTKVWYDSSCYTHFVLALRDSGFGKLADDLELVIGQENFTSQPSKTESDLSLASGDKVIPELTATTDVAKNIADSKKEDLFASNAHPDASSLPAKQKMCAAQSGDVSDSRFPDGVPPQDRDSSNAVLQPSVYSIPKSSNVSAAHHAVTATPHQASQLEQRDSMSTKVVLLYMCCIQHSSKPHLDQFGPPQSISSPPNAACTEPNSALSESYHSFAGDEYTDVHLLASDEGETAYYRKAAESRQGEIEDLKEIIDKKNSIILKERSTILKQRSTIQSLTLKIEDREKKLSELTESLKVAAGDKTEAIKTANDAEKAKEEKEESRRQNVATIKNLKPHLRKPDEYLNFLEECLDFLDQVFRSTKERGRLDQMRGSRR